MFLYFEFVNDKRLKVEFVIFIGFVVFCMNFGIIWYYVLNVIK